MTAGRSELSSGTGIRPIAWSGMELLVPDLLRLRAQAEPDRVAIDVEGAGGLT